jgi:hypothetical protein
VPRPSLQPHGDRGAACVPQHSTAQTPRTCPSATCTPPQEEPLPSLLRALPPAPSPKHAKRPWRDAGGGGVGEGSPEVLSLQRRLMAVVSGDPKLQALAADAFRCAAPHARPRLYCLLPESCTFVHKSTG